MRLTVLHPRPSETFDLDDDVEASISIMASNREILDRMWTSGAVPLWWVLRLNGEEIGIFEVGACPCRCWMFYVE